MREITPGIPAYTKKLHSFFFLSLSLPPPLDHTLYIHTQTCARSLQAFQRAPYTARPRFSILFKRAGNFVMISWNLSLGKENIVATLLTNASYGLGISKTTHTSPRHDPSNSWISHSYTKAYICMYMHICIYIYIYVYIYV